MDNVKVPVPEQVIVVIRKTANKKEVEYVPTNKD